MKGQWIFVLLCLTFAGKLVLGSIFPPIVQESTPQDTVITQQEVQMPLANLATAPEIFNKETNFSSRISQMEQTPEKNVEKTTEKNVEKTTEKNVEKIPEKNVETTLEKNVENGQKAVDILSKVVINIEQNPVTMNVVKNNTETETKKLPSTGN